MSIPLPQIVHPTFDITIPSTGKKNQSRPMETRERKVLLMAMESKDSVEISKAVRKICSACVSGIDPDKLTTFDLEWIFLQLIINSIRETIDLEIRIPKRSAECDECSKAKLVRTDLRQAKVEGEIRTKKSLLIDVGNGIGLKLKYPFDKDLEGLETNSPDKTEIEKVIDVISVSIESVFDNDKTFPFSEYSHKEKISWLEGLPPKVMDELEDFVNNIPKLALEINIECPKCKFAATHKLVGLSDFFV
jgi:hypothetical protein